MKRYTNLYEKIYSLENIREAHRNARKGKSHYIEVKMVDANPEYYFKQIHDMLCNRKYRTADYHVFKKYDSGKERTIYRLPYFPDRIVHHCIMQVIEPIWSKVFIRDTYASLKGRGVHDGVQRIKQALMNDAVGTMYCLKMDVKKFYPSVDHATLKQSIRGKIKCSRTLDLLDGIIDSADRGIPIGNYLSQYFGNLYLSGMDHWIKETLHCKYYFRYCDDLVILGADKARLHLVRTEIEQYLVRLKLTLKENWQIFPVSSRGIDFLGYVFFSTHTLIRKRIAKRMRVQLRLCEHRWWYMPKVCLLSTVMSYYGWQKHANAWNLYTLLVPKHFVNAVAYKCNNSKIKGIFL